MSRINGKKTHTRTLTLTLTLHLGPYINYRVNITQHKLHMTMRMEVHGRVEGRGRRGQTSPGEERGNETGKVAIAHGSVEFCEATPIGLADES